METEERRRVEMSRRAQLLCVWCGPVMLLSIVVGLVILAGFVPGPHPKATARQISSQYVHNLGAIRAGLCLFMAGGAPLRPRGAPPWAPTTRSRLRAPGVSQPPVALVA